MSALHCPECHADWHTPDECTACFHLMMMWELDNQLFDVHHLMVLCYHLQHPSLYSPQAFKGAKHMLVEFLEQGVTPQTMRERMREAVDSGTRTYKIKGTAAMHGQYARPIQWKMHATDVVNAGIEHYYASVQQWAESVLKSLHQSGNLE